MREEDIPHYLEMWKKTVEVQQHFNDLEWRIRGLAMTVLTFAFGAAAVAAKDGTTVKVYGYPLQLSCLVLILGCVLWGAFYFVDKVWYHQLLVGAVAHGVELEQELKTQLPHAGLTEQIGKSSPQEIRILLWKKELRSTEKLRLFYVIGATALLLAATALQFGSKPVSEPTKAETATSTPAATESSATLTHTPLQPVPTMPAPTGR
ncbi:hypothetical protein AB0I35_05955 [Nocardia sp. NPDC050378]|uniref:hypothetical protein n=1 Tax=Nocardia sp. NPDC050378 TaxID=3155400 RepID=UPI0033E58880